MVELPHASEEVFVSRRRREQGVASVEAALVLPFLMLLLFGIVEFSQAYALQNELRGVAHGAARYAATTGGTLNSTQIAGFVCDDLEASKFAGVRVDVSRSPQDPGTADPVGSRGSIGRAIVWMELPSITGFFDYSSITVSHTVDFVVEQPLDAATTWWPDSYGGGGSSGGFACP